MNERLSVISKVKNIATSNEVVTTTAGAFGTIEGLATAANVADGNYGLAAFFWSCYHSICY